MKGILFVSIALCAPVLAPAQGAKQEVWQTSIQGERSYCMAEVCMGMTLKEVMTIPGTQFKPWSSSQWKRNCDGSYGEWEQGDFISKDRTRYSVGFRDFPGDDERGDRFRVQSMALTTLLSWEDFTVLTDKISRRYDMRNLPGRSFDSVDQEWDAKGNGFVVRLNSMFSQPPKPSLISLSIFSADYPVWLSTQPRCANPVKPLPNV